MNRMRYCLGICLIVALLIYVQKHFLGYIHPTFIPTLVMVMGGYGALCAITAVRRMNRHLKHFAALPEEGKEGEMNRFYRHVTDVEDYCAELTDWLESEQKAQKKEKDKQSFQTQQHFFERVRALVDTQNQAAHVQVDIDLPGIGDLGSLTDMAEQRSASVVGLNVTISFLLILGILGTLFGIHECMSDGDSLKDISELSTALWASICAVAITVALMMAKGVYQTKRIRYTSALNRFTLLHLIPHLQRDSEHDAMMEGVESGAKGFYESVTYVDRFAEAVQQVNADMLRETAAASACLERMSKLAQHLEKAVLTGSEEVEQQKCYYRLMLQSAEQLESRSKELMHLHNRSSLLAILYSRKQGEQVSVMQTLADRLRASMLQLAEAKTAFSENSRAADEIPGSIAALCASDSKILLARRESDTLLDAMKQRREDWNSLLQKLEAFMESSESLLGLARGVSEQVEEQTKQTGNFLYRRMPEDFQAEMTALPQRMKENAALFRRYSRDMESVSHRAMLQPWEIVGLSVILGAVLVKIVWVIYVNHFV